MSTNPCTTLPDGAGICAFDRDECTVTLALDNEAQVRALLDALPMKSRVYLVDDDEPLSCASLQAGQTGELVEALADELQALVTVVTFAYPPKESNGVLCYEALVPVEFIEDARAVLAKHKAQPLTEGGAK